MHTCLMQCLMPHAHMSQCLMPHAHRMSRSIRICHMTLCMNERVDILLPHARWMSRNYCLMHAQCLKQTWEYLLHHARRMSTASCTCLLHHMSTATDVYCIMHMSTASHVYCITCLLQQMSTATHVYCIMHMSTASSTCLLHHTHRKSTRISTAPCTVSWLLMLDDTCLCSARQAHQAPNKTNQSPNNITCMASYTHPVHIHV